MYLVEKPSVGFIISQMNSKESSDEVAEGQSEKSNTVGQTNN